ncbi:PucR family transcriptional regulator [Brevibacillus laterosporus]|uniref:PucR family transcriptional regulator n=1 Tax=Brevibacillus TaxID=55080 RepID=UPI0002EE0DBC|nr:MULTISPECIES: PucR family transcriptional regulator ligand-binding domain-containing protein [Brevibacillus]AUM65088.1 PucR family transcriptional regulator [Brevibacillus laterosporus]MCR8963537.1 PucR family transcriptional regulator ligand-binding domain-containing protein [Brevibacillus laterosporus]MCZ0835693.1 PucR family transcriptional regulator ligand-binding domain-containing protein [Brevibacillus halotolerans]MDF9411264.1 PucR family transcriptional regulator [Brevibacillus later
MEFRVEHILRMQRLQDAKVLGGENGLSNVIKGITIMEAPDIADWLKGGEMLLTSLYPIRNYTEDEQREFVLRLAEKKVSALMIKNHRFVQKIPDAIVEAGEQVALPIIQIPQDIPYVDVLYPVMEELFNNQVMKLKYFIEVHDRFTALSLTDAGLESIITTLGELIGNPVAIYDRNFVCMTATSSYTMPIEQRDSLVEREKEVETKFPYYWLTAQILEGESQPQFVEQVVVPIRTINHIKVHLVITEAQKRLEELDFIAMENAATALSLELVKQFAVAEVEREFKNDIIDDLLAGKSQMLETVYHRANLIGWDLDRSYAVLLFHVKEEFTSLSQNEMDKLRSTRSLQTKTFSDLHEAVRSHFVNGIFRRRGDTIILLLPVNEQEGKGKSWLSAVKERAREIQDKIRAKAKDIVVQVGIGNVAETVMDISRSYQEAQDALDLGEKLYGKESITAFAELGLFRLLCQFPDPAVLTSFIPPSLNRLVESKSAIKNDLLHTLEVFLEHNQNAAKAAHDLFVHYKTVMYRLERIREITSMDFEDSEEMLGVRVGLKILNLVKTEK